MTIRKIRTEIVDIPLRRPHVMSLMTVYEVNFLFVFAESSDGAVGYGEAAFLGGPTWSEESVESAKAVVDRYLTPYMIGKDPERLEDLRMLMERLVRGNHFAKAAVEMALFDLVGKLRGVPVYDLIGGKVRDEVSLSWSLASGDPELEEKEAGEMIAKGGHIFKFKTGLLRPEQDVARVRHIRETFGADISLRIDANQGWNREQAIRAISQMEEYGLDFAEQPLPREDVEGLTAVAKAVHVPLLADESLDSIPHALELIRRNAVGMFGLKLTKAGGILGTKRLAALAEAAGFPCYVGCMIETGVGNAAYLHLALSTPQVTMGCELFGPMLLADTITTEEPEYVPGAIALTKKRPGLGVEIDRGQFEKYRRKG